MTSEGPKVRRKPVLRFEENGDALAVLATGKLVSVNSPCASMRRCLREPLPVCTHGSPPGVYWYQIGTVNGPRLSPALTAPRCGVRRAILRPPSLSRRVQHIGHFGPAGLPRTEI
jgi:hypothetical protein